MIPAGVLLTMFLAAAAPAVGYASTATATPGQAPDATLPATCSDQRVAPASVVILCGDAGVIARDLVWHDWGAPSTSATETSSLTRTAAGTITQVSRKPVRKRDSRRRNL
jgi:hypothetical protein